MLICLTDVSNEVRCTSCGKAAEFYNDEADVFYCYPCACFLAEKMINILVAFWLIIANLPWSLD